MHNERRSLNPETDIEILGANYSTFPEAFDHMVSLQKTSRVGPNRYEIVLGPTRGKARRFHVIIRK